ncbi:MAG: GDP-L-fucose synthase [Bacteroidetes bacterium]|nr:GDP-L-fucose synthase [Bacteroidota bacterium]
MKINEKIYIAGHSGLVGAAIVRKLQSEGYDNLVMRTSSELDLINQSAVQAFFRSEKIDLVYLAAAKVGGIHANSSYPAEFIYQNLMIEANVIEANVIEANVIDAAFRSGVKQLLFFGSSCIYPKLAEQPMREDALLTGPLEPTNEPYAVAKIAGIKLCESYNRQYSESHGIDYRSVMSTNLYGPGDNYHPENCHVIPALIRRFHEAKQCNAPSVTVWGTGNPRREFLHVHDMAAAAIHIMNVSRQEYELHTRPMCNHMNIGSGTDITIRELAEIVARVVGYEGEIEFDPSQPDGTLRKLMDSSRIKNLGWQPVISLKEGLKHTYKDYCISIDRGFIN